MYNEAYIKAFEEEIYVKYLRKTDKLQELADDYLKKYSEGSDAYNLALKESLDHYVAKKISENPNIIYTNEFKNYFQYLKTITLQKGYMLKDKTKLLLEFNTNVIFEYLNDDLLNRISPGNRVGESFRKNQNIINMELQKIKDNQTLSTEELEFISDYLDSKKDIQSKEYTDYIRYIFKNNDKITSSPKIVSAILSYLPGYYIFRQQYKKC